MQSSDDQDIITISQDGMEAHATMGPMSATIDSIKEILVRSGVVCGVLHEAFQGIVEGRTNGHPVLVAKGTQAVHGKDGWVEYLFDHGKATPVEKKNGEVDLHEMHFVNNVRHGQQLARIHPPEAGAPGKMVTGHTVQAKEGAKVVVKAGPCTGFSPEDTNVLIALSDGNIVLRVDGTVEVQPTLVLQGNVDFSTGNIDFVGSLKVLGDVKSDFVVKVAKDLEVLGNIEDARLEIGGDVKVKQGFIGNGKGVLTAKGTVTVQHVLNQSIIGAKDIVIEKECVNGNIKAGGRIVLLKGVIAGGHLEADLEVDVNDLGSGEYTQPRVRVGHKGRILERLGQLEKDIQCTEKQINDVKDGVYKLIRMKLDAGSISPEKGQMLTKLQEIQKILPSRLQAFHEEKKLLTEELKQESTARVVVRGTVLDNVLIDINGVKKLVEHALKDVIFVEHAGQIEAHSS